MASTVAFKAISWLETGPCCHAPAQEGRRHGLGHVACQLSFASFKCPFFLWKQVLAAMLRPKEDAKVSVSILTSFLILSSYSTFARLSSAPLAWLEMHMPIFAVVLRLKKDAKFGLCSLKFSKHFRPSKLPPGPIFISLGSECIFLSLEPGPRCCSPAQEGRQGPAFVEPVPPLGWSLRHRSCHRECLHRPPPVQCRHGVGNRVHHCLGCGACALCGARNLLAPTRPLEQVVLR